MAEVVDAIRFYLLEQAPNKDDIVALVGTRIYVDAAPEDTNEPHVILTELSMQPQEHLGGQSHFDDAGIKVECRADKPSIANQTRKLIRDSLHGFRGMLDTIFVSNISVETALGYGDAPQDGSAIVKRGRLIHFKVQHQS